MEAKMKAVELVKKFLPHVYGGKRENPETLLINSKFCACIVCDEVMGIDAVGMSYTDWTCEKPLMHEWIDIKEAVNNIKIEDIQ